MIQNEYDNKFKVLILGDQGVGKTSMVFRYTDGDFETNRLVTLGIDFRFKTIEIQEKKIRLQLFDYIGAERFRPVSQYFTKGANGVFILFDITNLLSFKSKLFQQIDALRKVLPQNTPIILIGSKSDLERERKVTKQQAQKFASQNNLDYSQISSKDDINVNQVFNQLTIKMLKNTIPSKLIQKQSNSNTQPIKTPKYLFIGAIITIIASFIVASFL